MDNSEALLIGIQTYDQPKIFSPLSTDLDVLNVSEALKDSKYEISGMIFNPAQTTTEALERTLQTFLAPDGRSGEALIYISGHGYQEFDRVNRDCLNGYLATSDCKVHIEADSIPNSPVFSLWPPGLSLNLLNQWIHKSNRSSVVLLIDACHSGHAALQASLLQNSFTRGRLRNFHVIAACQDSETAKSREGGSSTVERGGIFTRCLVEGLSQETGYRNPEGKITSGILFEFIYRRLTNPGAGGTVKQRPIHANYADAPIILKEYASLPQEDPLVIVPPPPIPDKEGQLLHPYPGLKSFEEKHTELFFGREEVVDQIQQKLKQSTFVPIIGASGSGKSSVVRAGLIPVLKKETDWKVLEPIKPGRHALGKLARALAQILEGHIDNSIFELLKYGSTSAKAAAMPALVSTVASLPASPRFLLFVDQFEEIFTLVTKETTQDISQTDNSLSQAEQKLFIELLTQTALAPGSPVSVVMTMRADFVGDCLQYETLHRQIQGNCAIFIPPMKRFEYERAIVEPARRQGGNVEPKLLAALLDDAESEPGSLPLLQFALEQLWDKRNEKNELTWDAYDSLGQVKASADSEPGAIDNKTTANGLKRALNMYADEVYLKTVAKDEVQKVVKKEDRPSRPRTTQEQEWIRQIFVNLVRTGEGSTDTRQRQLEADLLGIVKDSTEQRYALKALIDDLVDSRLLVRGDADPTVIQALLKQQPGTLKAVDASALVEQPDAIKMVDLAHEALIGGWQQFAKWLQEDREVRRVAEQMQDARRKWKAAAPTKKTEYLMMGALLSQAREYWRDGTLKPYLLDSQEDMQNQTDSKTFYSLSDQYEKSGKLKLQQALVEAEVQFKAATVSNKLAEGNRLRALTLAIQAAGKNREHLPHKMLGPVQQSLFKFVDPVFPPPEIRCLGGHTGFVKAVAVSPDGQTIVSGSIDNTVRVWSMNGTLLRTLEGHTNSVFAVAVSPDGQTIVSGSYDKTVRLWSMDGTLLRTLEGHMNSVYAVAVSPDGQTIVSGSEDSTVRVWSMDGTLLRTLEGHTSSIPAIAVSPDGQTIVSGSNDSTVRVWRIDGTLLRTLEGHTGPVYAVAVSPDGQTIVSGSEDNTVRLWSMDGTLLRTLEGHMNSVDAIAVSPDGQTIVSGSNDNTVRLWSMDGTLLRTLEGHMNSVYAVAVGPDGQTIVSGSDDSTVRVWSMDGTLLRTLEGHMGSVYAVAVSPDGQTIVSGSYDKTVRVWSMDGTLLRTLEGHMNSVKTVAVSPDGQTIVSGSHDKTVRLWSMDGTLLRTLEGHTDSVDAIALSQDGQTIVSGSYDKTVRLWSMNGTLLRTLEGHTNSVFAVAVSPDGQTIVSGSYDKTVRLWSMDGTLLRTLEGHTNSVFAVAVSPDGQTIVSGSDDNTVRVWSMDGTLLRTLEGHTDSVNAVAVSPDGQTIVSGSADSTVRVWRIDGTLLRTLEGHMNSVYAVAVSPDGQTIVSGSEDSTVRVWSMDGTLLRTLEGHTSSIPAIAVSPDGQTIVSGSNDSTVRVWRIDGTLLRTLEGHTGPVYAVAVSPDGQTIVSGSEDNTVRLWSMDGTLLRTLEGHMNSVDAIAVSPDGQTIVSGSNDSTVRVWRIDGTLLRTLEGHTSSVYAVAVSPDGQTIVSGSNDSTVRVWSMDGTLLRTLEGHMGPVYSVALSPDGQTIVSGSADSTVRVWSMDGTLLRTLEGHTDSVKAVAVSPDGQTIVSGSHDKTVRLWSMDGTLLRTLEGHTNSVFAVALSPDGQTIVSGSDDNTVRVWSEVGWRSWLKTCLGHLGNRWINNNDTDGIAARTRLFESGYSLAEEGEIEQAINQFKLALTCGNGTVLDIDELTSSATHAEVLAKNKVAVEALAKKKVVPFLVNQAKTLALQADELATQARYELVLAKLEQAREFDPFLQLEPEASTKQLMASRLKRDATLSILQGKPTDGLDTFKEAQVYDSTVLSMSEAEAKRIAASALVDQARWMVFTVAATPSFEEAKSRIEAALAKLEQAKQYDSSLIELNLTAEVESYAAPAFIEQGKRLVQAGRAEGALKAYETAKAFDPNLKISVVDWNTLCWLGTLYAAKQNKPKLVRDILAVSEAALKAEQNNTSCRDTLGVARVLAGGKKRWESAIKDFEFCIATGNLKQEDPRQQFIAALKAALQDPSRKKYKNLFTEETVDQLLNE